jgi:hypothetical protein
MVIDTHTRAIFREFALRLQHTPVFSLPGAVRVVEEGTHPRTSYLESFSHKNTAGLQALHVHLCADEVVIVTIEPRTGKISLRDTGDLGAAGRGPSFLAISEKLNENPTVLLLEALTRLRIKVREPTLPATNDSSCAPRPLSIWQSRKRTIWAYRCSGREISTAQVSADARFLFRLFLLTLFFLQNLSNLASQCGGYSTFSSHLSPRTTSCSLSPIPTSATRSSASRLSQIARFQVLSWRILGGLMWRGYVDVVGRRGR